MFKKNFIYFIFYSLIFNLNLAYALDCPEDITGLTDPAIIDCNITASRLYTEMGLNSITNNSSMNRTEITSGSDIKGIHVNGSIEITSIINNGSINITGGDGSWVVGIYNGSALITSLVNNGAISTIAGVSPSSSYGIANQGQITELTNFGSIKTIAGDGTIENYGIKNFSGATITNLINLQGQLGSFNTPLFYDGDLPNNYSVVIRSETEYGKIIFSNGVGITNFSIHSSSILSPSHKYENVLDGIDVTSIASGTTGTFTSGSKSYSWLLTNKIGSTTIWDLDIGLCTGCPSVTKEDTQSSLQRLASGLRSSYNSASLISNFPNSNTYDCNLFDVKGMCISAGGRYSTVDNPNSNSTAAVVTLGYKVNPNIRIGGFLDQSVNNSNPTGINLSNKNPMMGVFAYWNQNADGLGYQVKLANAYQDKDLSTTRDVIGTSEAGRGTTSLNSRSYVSELSYAFMYKENTLVRPYFALRYTTIEQDAYTERGVEAPLTYSALNDRTTSALMGVKFKHALTPKANLIGSLGVEQDLHHKTGQLTATSASIAGLTSENFSGDIHRTRPVASIGATYDIAKSQRLPGEVLVQQLPFQSTAGATAYFNYMIGF